MRTKRTVPLDTIPDDGEMPAIKKELLLAHGHYHDAMDQVQKAKDLLILAADQLTALLVLRGWGLDVAISMVHAFCEETCHTRKTATNGGESGTDANGILQFRDEVKFFHDQDR